MTRSPTASPAREAARPRGRTAGITDVVLVALAASVAGLGNQLAHDDLHLIQENARVQDLTALGDIFARPFWPPPFSQDLYRPLTTFLLALQFAVGNGEPIVFRVVSYALYAASAGGVFLLARRFVAPPAALAAAALFAAHPVHVEAVALAVGQAEIVVALLAILSVALYHQWRLRGSLGAREWATLALLYGVASLFKENALVLPALLAAAELLVPGQRRTSWKTLAPGYAALAGVALAVLALRVTVLGELRGTFVTEALDGVTTGERLLTVLGVVPEWVRLFLWPAHLRLDYSPSEFVASTSLGAREAAGLLMVIGLLAAAWRARRQAPLVTFGIVWMGIAILPVSNLLVPTGVLIAERTLFLPTVGLALIVAGAIQALASTITDPRARKAALAACIALVIAGVVRSAERHRVWRHDGFLAVRTASDAPRSFRAQRAYADVLFEIRQPDAAHAAYARALEYAPPQLRWRVHNDYARQLRARGDRAGEIRELRASLAQRPDQEDARGHLVAALLEHGEYDAAAAQADSAIARGARRDVFQGLKAVADSARRASAPPGSVRVAIVPAPSAPVRP